MDIKSTSKTVLLDESAEETPNYDDEEVENIADGLHGVPSYPVQPGGSSINDGEVESESPPQTMSPDDYSNIKFRNRANINGSFCRSIDETLYESTESRPCETTKDKVKMSSRRIPQWVMTLMLHILGVQSQSTDTKTPCLALFLRIITILIACTFTVTGVIHTVYDILSSFSDTSLFIGVVNIIIGFSWICLGIYSNQLARKLFSNRNFVQSIRLHSRTFFKISAAGLMIFLGVAAVVINGYTRYEGFGPRHCQKLRINTYICHVMYSSHVTFSVISLLWNLLVGCMLLSVCRTHTVGVRRFIRVLEDDAKTYTELCNGKHPRLQQNGNRNMDFISLTANRSEWFIWDDGCALHEGIRDRVGQCQSQIDPHHSVIQVPGSAIPEVNSHPSGSNSQDGNSLLEARQENKKILTNEEVLMCYWKISHRMRITSICLQRWLVGWILFVLLWCGDYVLYWISHHAMIMEVIECIIPLLLLLIVTSAFAEANGEGQRMIRCICPTEARLKLLYFLNQQPLQMQVFNFPITYNAIFGVIAAFSVAFASRIILDEVYGK